MKMRLPPWLIMLTAVSSATVSSIAVAAPTAAEIAAGMRKVRLTPGFEARLQVEEVAPDGQRSGPTKVAIIGQFDAAHRRLLLRGIAPETIRGEIRIAESGAGGCTHAVDRNGTADVFAPLFGTGLVAWDMLAPWWEWPRQSLAGTDEVAGRKCTLVRSRTRVREAPIREVLSCVDADAGLALRTQFFDDHGALVRGITVVTTMRKESGLLAAKKVAIASGGKLTETEAYSGDEQYEVPPDAFAKLEGAAACR